MILMKHPLHGEMHVYTQTDVELNEKNGWVKYAPPVLESVENVQPIRKTMGLPKGKV